MFPCTHAASAVEILMLFTQVARDGRESKKKPNRRLKDSVGTVHVIGIDESSSRMDVVHLAVSPRDLNLISPPVRLFTCEPTYHKMSTLKTSDSSLMLSKQCREMIQKEKSQSTAIHVALMPTCRPRGTVMIKP